MIRLPSLLLGLFGAFALGWLVLTVLPYAQLRGLQAQVDEDTGDVYPVAIGGLADAGLQVYVANGCVYCHTQQVVPPQFGTDIERGWAGEKPDEGRPTVALDYLYAKQSVLGQTRLGPDLANYGLRAGDPAQIHLHLYSPRSVQEGSTMPPYRFLYRKQQITGARSEDALELKGADAVGPDWEVVPTPEARALVGYLMSLKRNHPLKAPAAPAPAAVASN